MFRWTYDDIRNMNLNICMNMLVRTAVMHFEGFCHTARVSFVLCNVFLQPNSSTSWHGWHTPAQSDTRRSARIRVLFADFDLPPKDSIQHRSAGFRVSGDSPAHGVEEMCHQPPISEGDVARERATAVPGTAFGSRWSGLYLLTGPSAASTVAPHRVTSTHCASPERLPKIEKSCS